MKYCQVCGAEVADTAKFCRKCGAKLGAAAEVQNEAEAPEERFSAQQEEAAGQPLGEEQPVFEGSDYQWGPPTGGENYDEPAMPAVFLRDAEERERAAEDDRQQAYTYRLDAPDYDHTDEFDAEDISRNKVTAMAAYLLGPLGVIIALLAGKDSPYADFHMRQGLKFVVVEALISFIALLLCWTIVVPAAAVGVAIILEIVKIVTFVSVCKGRAVEPAIIRSLRFLK